MFVRLHEAQLAEMTRRKIEQEQQQKHQEQQQAMMERKEQQKRIALGIHEDTLATVVKGEAVTIATRLVEVYRCKKSEIELMLYLHRVQEY